MFPFFIVSIFRSIFKTVRSRVNVNIAAERGEPYKFRYPCFDQLLKSVEIVGEMTNKCQRFPLNPRKIVGCFAAGIILILVTNISVCHSRDLSNESYFNFRCNWMETLSGVKINFLFSKKPIFEDFEFRKNCFSSYLARIFLKLVMIQNRLEYFCPKKKASHSNFVKLRVKE